MTNGGFDLLHALAHEFGHLLGWGDLDADAHGGELMAGEISPEPSWRLPALSIPGVRRLDLTAAAFAEAADLLGPAWLRQRERSEVAGSESRLREVELALGERTPTRQDSALLSVLTDEDNDPESARSDGRVSPDLFDEALLDLGFSTRRGRRGAAVLPGAGR